MKSTPNDIKRYFENTKVIKPAHNPPLRFFLKKPTFFNRVDAIFSPDKFSLDEVDVVVTERIIEFPFVFRVLEKREGMKVFEFGCANSLLSYQLVNSGYSVTGIDLREYRLPNKNFEFIKGNLFDVDLPKNQFDAVIAVSALEHIGLAAYKEKQNSQHSDKKAVEIFHDLLKPNGQLIFTVPAGLYEEHRFFRIYDENSLIRLLEKFSINMIEYYAKYNNTEWEEVSEKEIIKYSWKEKYNGNGSFGVACISATAS